MISFACVNCELDVHVKDELAGHLTNCPRCKRSLLVPDRQPRRQAKLPESTTAKGAARAPSADSSQRTANKPIEHIEKRLAEVKALQQTPVAVEESKQIEDTEKRLTEVKAFQETLVAVERELDAYRDLLLRRLASLKKGPEEAGLVVDTVVDNEEPAGAVP
jgi:hypothetical protein